MSATQPILDSIRQHLLATTTDFEVELFPEDPQAYRLNAPLGAILIQYAGSTFKAVESTDIVQQQREVLIAITILARSQHDELGALAMLDQVRLAIVGFCPTNCQPCWLLKEEFDHEDEGIWIYQLFIKTSTRQVQRVTPEDKPKMQSLYLRQSHHPLNPHLTPKTQS